MQCDYGSVYTACGSPCPQTCRNIGDEPEAYCDSTTCVEGCFCPEGYVEQGTFYEYALRWVDTFSGEATLSFVSFWLSVKDQLLLPFHFASFLMLVNS